MFEVRGFLLIEQPFYFTVSKNSSVLHCMATIVGNKKLQMQMFN